MPARPRPLRGLTRPAWPGGISTARPMPAPSAARRPGRELAAPRRCAGRARRRARGAAPGSRASACRHLETAAPHSERGAVRAEAREAARLGLGQVGADHHALGGVLALDRRAQRVQGGQLLALPVRHQQLDRLEAVRRRTRRSWPPAPRGPRPCGPRQHGVGVGVLQPAARDRVEQVGLVQHQQPRRSRPRRSRPAPPRRRACCASALLLRRRGVGDVEHAGRPRSSPRASTRTPRRGRAAACG